MDHSNRNLAFHPKSIATGPSSPCRINEILEALRSGQRFLVCSHARPDGDAVGSMLAMGMLLEQLGKEADLVSADRVPKIHRALPGAEAIRCAQQVSGIYDAAILLECDGMERTRLLGLDQYFMINIDHHATGCEFGQLNWIDRSAASVGELVYRLAKAAGVQITPEMATYIYTTVLTDTGGFCYGGTQASTFELARELVLAGADPMLIAQNIYFSTPTSKLLLLGAALRNLKHEGQLAWLWVTRQEMMEANASEEDCEGIVTFALCVSGVEAAVFLFEQPEGRIQIGLRSKGRINVAAIAGQLGGGGHESAAGCSMKGPLESAREQLLALLRPCLAEAAENMEQ
ncbi:MAG: bifunctional oligoribonuclease/PAP phosphatase NrnA [Terracidiphilus sp.]